MTALLVSSATAVSVAEVSLTPTQTAPGKNFEFSLSVKNLAGDNINKVELVVPQQDDTPLYLIREIGSPVEWTYESRYTLGAPAPVRIIWSTADSGISAGETVKFNLIMSPPQNPGDYSFEWETIDLTNAESFGKVTVTNFQPLLADFKIDAVNTTKAGNEITFKISAMDQNNKIKTDYKGTVKFFSSDPLAVLPNDYTFQNADMGERTFRIKLKTAGIQEVKVSDREISKSFLVNVLQSDIASIELSLSNSTVMPSKVVTLTVTGKDVYGNTKDVTQLSKFVIDREAKGKLVNNTYQTEVEGMWTLVASYVSVARELKDGETLTVTSVVPEPPPVEEPPVEEEKKMSLEMLVDELITIPVNTTKTFQITVKNTGEVDLKDVVVVFTGFSDQLLEITPEKDDIDVGKSKRYTAKVFVPEEMEPQSVTFLVLSLAEPAEKVNATQIVTFNITAQLASGGTAPTGRFVFNLDRNLAYLGIAVGVAILLVVLFWFMFLREEKGRRAE